MSVTIKDVEHIAKLARLDIKENELGNYTKHLNSILDYMEKLNELDTSGVEPLSNPIENTNFFREDLPVRSIPREEALKNAPARTDEHFKVPKVINQD